MNAPDILRHGGGDPNPLQRLLERGVEEGAFPGAQACVIRAGELLFLGAAGRRSISGPPVEQSTRFDVASLTKVMATTSAAYILASGGALRLDDPVGRFFAPFGSGPKQAVQIRHLLAHTSGLPAWRPLFAGILADPQLRALYPEAGGPEPAFIAADARQLSRLSLLTRARRAVIDEAAATPLALEPGHACVYSDLGFLLLGEIIATCAGMPLDRFCDEWIYSPLQLQSTGYRPLLLASPGAFAATGRTRPREPARGQEGLFEIPPQREHDDAGEVDDDNAWAMGGVAGHAGLFSTALDVARWGDAVRAERAGARQLGDPDFLEQLLAPDSHAEGPSRSFGFDIPSGVGSSAGSLLGRAGPLGARGHLGFTGCSIWIDFDRELVVALLTNRVHPSRNDDAGIRAFRPAFHDAVIDLFDNPSGRK